MSGTNTTTPTTTDPEAAQAGSLSFPDAYAASGLPTAFYPAAYAQFGQESGYGKADPANPLRVTAATAANPGYGLQPMDPRDLTDPSKAQKNLTFGLQYAAALARSKGIDPSTPDGAASLLASYNGGGDPNYVQHVADRMPASAGTSDVGGGQSGPSAPAPSAPDAEAAQAGQAAFGQQQQPVQPAPISYTPPPMPKGLADRLSDTTGLWKTQRQRELLAMAGGFLSGSGAGAGNFGAGLGRALNAAGQVDQQQADLQQQAYKDQLTTAQAAMLAQRYQGQQLLGGGQLQNKVAVTDEKVRHDGVTEDQGQQRVDNQGRSVDLKGQQITQQGLIGAANAQTNRDRAASQAANLGAPAVAPIAPGSLPGMGASGLPGQALPPAPQQPSAQPQQAPQQPPTSGQPGSLVDHLGASANANLAASGGSPVPPLPGVGASGLAGGMAPTGQPAPAVAPQSPGVQPPSSAVYPTGQLQQAPMPTPQVASQGAPQVPPTGLQQPQQGPVSAPQAGLSGVGSSGLSTGFPMAGSIYDGLQGGLMARRQTQAKVQAENHKENEGDTAALESMQAADTLGQSQKALLAKVQAANPGLTGSGLIAKAQQYFATQTNDPLVQEIQKNEAAMATMNLPHGVGQLRVPEIVMAQKQAPGLGVSGEAGQHLIDQQMAARAQVREILQARQNFIAAHPQEDAGLSFDPVANAYLAKTPAFTEGPNGIVAAKPGLADFARSHTNPQTGRYDPSYEAQQAGAAAFPAQPTAPAAQGALAPSPASSPAPSTAPAAQPAAPARTATGAHGEKYVLQNGAWVQTH